MTVAQDILKSGPYNTDGVTKTFAATFQYLEDSDVVVTLLNTTTGAILVGALTTDYTLVDNISPIIGGTITIANNGFGGIANSTGVIAAGYTITINPNIPVLQGESYPNAGTFPSAAVEQALDRLTLICQNLQLSTSQSLKYPVTDSSTISNTLPNSTLRANNLLGFDSLGNPVAVAATIGGSVTIATAMIPVVQSTTTMNAAKLLLNGNISSLAAAIVDTNVWEQFTTSVNSYAQAIFQNTNNGATASTDIVINNDQGTTTTHYINIGMNSSGFTGSGSLNKAGAGYVTTTTGDLVIGTTTANAIRFVYNSQTTDSAYIDSTGLNAPSMNGGPLAGLRNRIINGDMAIDQRNAGAAQTITTGGGVQYTVDRWASSVAGANVTGQRVAGTGADQFYYQYTGAASNTAIQHFQRIEASNIYDLASTTVTLSAVLANSLLTTVSWEARYANSIDNWAGATSIATGNFTVTSTPTRYSTQIALPANAQNGIMILITVANQVSGTFKIGRVQLECGSVATNFEIRPRSFELDACLRYYEKSFVQGTAPAQNVGSTGAYSWNVPTGASGIIGGSIPLRQKRVIPTVTTYNPLAANANFRDTTNSTDKAVTVGDIGENNFRIEAAACVAASTIRIHWAASAEL